MRAARQARVDAAGIMRGAGRQLLASILNLISYWGLGLPLALLLGVHWGLGVQGLWWGLAATTSVQVSPLLSHASHLRRLWANAYSQFDVVPRVCQDGAPQHYCNACACRSFSMMGQ